MPVDIVEDHAAGEARERSEAEAAQREKDDLVAQQGMNSATQAMNEATQRMASSAAISTALVGIGTALLFVTLYLTWQANKAAQAAVTVTREIGKAQVRAYLTAYATISGPGIGVGRKPVASMTVKNTGQSPAYQVNYITTLFVDDYPAAVSGSDDLIEPELGDTPPNVTIPAGSSVNSEVDGDPIADKDIRPIMNEGARALYFCCIIKYVDVFGDNHSTKVLAFLSPNGEFTVAEDGGRIRHYGFSPAVGH